MQVRVVDLDRIRLPRQTRRTANGTISDVSAHAVRRLAGFALLIVAGGTLASCDTPVGVSPALKGTYWQHAIVTNPYGGGPMEVRWGPPEPSRVPDGNY